MRLAIGSSIARFFRLVCVLGALGCSGHVLGACAWQGGGAVEVKSSIPYIGEIIPHVILKGGLAYATDGDGAGFDRGFL